MRIAIIGLGEIARKAYLPILTGKVELDIVLSSHSETSLRQVQAQTRISRGTTDLEEVIRNKPRAAFVLTPKETHFEIIRRLLEADIDVFVEKPATMHTDETEQLAELADRRGHVLMVGFNRRFAPLHIKAHELLVNQTISVGLFQKHRSDTIVTSLSEQFLEDTIHQIDLLRFYCGEGEPISTVQQVQDHNLQGAVGTIALTNGGIAVIATTLQAGGWNETYALHGSSHSIFIDAFERLRLITSLEEKTWQEPYASSWKTTLESRGFTGEIDHFLECVQKRCQPLTSAWDSVKTQRLLEQMVSKAKV